MAHRDVAAVMRAALLVLGILAAARRDAIAGPEAPPTAAQDEPTDDIDRDAAPSKGATRGPSVAAAISAAYRAAGLDRDPSSGWISRARIAGLIPWVTIRGARDTSWQDAQPDIGHSQTIEVRATWRLDRLLFDGRELHVAGIEAARHRERRRLATRVIRAYFTWRRALSAAGNPGGGIRVEEATAELDALTDGWFSRDLASATRRVSPNGP